MHMSILTRNILISLVITFLIIGTIAYAVSYLNGQRVAQLNEIENQLSTDTLSVETQYTLLANAPCSDFTSTSTTESTSLSQEVSDLGDKLAYAEDRLGATDPQVLQLKDQYTLLEIRDYLLTKQLSTTCHITPTVVLYFYSNVPNECINCDRAGVALSYLRQTYPRLRVYSFDYHLNLAALNTLKSLEKVQQPFPAFVIDGKQYNGFTSLEDFEKDFPASLFATSTATSTATTTVKKK
jgi:hypothetical protein